MPKQIQEMTVDEAAKFLRTMAERTALLTQNWDAYEAICKDMIQSAVDHVSIEDLTGIPPI